MKINWKKKLEFLRSTPLHPQWLFRSSRKILPWVRNDTSGLVLDIGAADRWIEAELPSSCHYVALDYPATGAILYGATPDVFADAARIPLKNKSVDSVIFLEVLEHLEFPDLALKEIGRVLKDDGVLLMSLPFLYPIHDSPYDFQRYTKFGLKRELEAAGLEIEEMHNALGSTESAGLLFSLAIAGSVLESLENRKASLILAPIFLTLIPLINISAWLIGKLLPSWSNVSSGYQIKAVKQDSRANQVKASVS